MHRNSTLDVAGYTWSMADLNNVQGCCLRKTFWARLTTWFGTQTVYNLTSSCQPRTVLPDLMRSVQVFRHAA